MSTNPEVNKMMVRRFCEAMNTQQYDTLDELVAPNFLRHCQATPQVDIRNLEQFKDFLRHTTAAYPDMIQTITQILAEGDLVAVWATFEGTQKGYTGPFPPTGKKMRAEFAAFLRVENGKIAEMWLTWDNIAILTQLGHIPLPPNQNA